MRQVVADGVAAQSHPPDLRDYRGEMRDFYESQDYALAWVKDSQVTRQTRELVKLFEAADDDGLRSENYGAREWSTRLDGWERAKNPPEESELIDFDVGFTAAVMRYVSDRCAGRFNPQRARFELAAGNGKKTLPQFLRDQVEQSSDVAATVRAVDPVFPSYERLATAYRLYRSLAAHDNGLSLPIPWNRVDPGGSYPAVAKIRERLALLGDLSAKKTAGDEARYNDTLIEAVKRFQRRHGLEENGKLDARTVEQLNVPLSSRAEQLRLTMERWRWLPRSYARPPLIINIPEFRLHADDENLRWTFFMNVVVGKAYKRETPVFESRITRVIFRPYWRIPKSIQKEELVPEIEKDPEYLRTRDYEVVDKEGEVVSSGTVDQKTLQDLESGLLSVRQRPGPNNFLGLVKFAMPNEHGVYLHDTPAKELFSKKRRDFSHGCIRVEDPVKLAAWALRELPGWTPDKIRATMAGGETVTIALPHPIPVLVVYGTAVVMEDGEIRFFDDIYGYDDALKKAWGRSLP